MIDPIESLSFSIQANPGVYALLLGSGISRPAGIPTGWEITLDLVGKLAALNGEACESGPVDWFLRKYRQPPDYSMLLDELAKTRTERQQLLLPYFEADQQEREERLKQPTAAHHAIAHLAAQGFFRVIITTNFDRLTESALREAGVEPAVLSSPDDLKGALPLPHLQCCVLKIHGDYRDTRIRNTPDELDEYPEEINRFLDRVFDEFGLLVCGWSATWDGALRDAIRRIPSRRFTTYWATRGEPSDEAQRLIENRRAQVIPIDDADSFYQKVLQKVEAIEEFRKLHPLSTDVAVANLKRFLSEPRYKIQLADLIEETVEQVIERTSGDDFDVNSPAPTKETFTARIRAYEAVCSTLMAMATVGGRWSEKEHCEVWQRALQRLSMVPRLGGTIKWLDMRGYSGALLLYALGIGSVEADRLNFLSQVFSTRVYNENREQMHIVHLLAPYLLIDGGRLAGMLEGKENYHLPLNEWMYETLQKCFKREVPDEEQFETIFVKLEILISLNTAYQPKPIWMGNAYGTFMYRYETTWNVLQEIKQSISTLNNDSPFVIADIFGKTTETCIQHLADLEMWISQTAEQQGRHEWRMLQGRAGQESGWSQRR